LSLKVFGVLVYAIARNVMARSLPARHYASSDCTCRILLDLEFQRQTFASDWIQAAFFLGIVLHLRGTGWLDGALVIVLPSARVFVFRWLDIWFSQSIDHSYCRKICFCRNKANASSRRSFVLIGWCAVMLIDGAFESSWPLSMTSMPGDCCSWVDVTQIGN
jgi:hypothetical protein